MRMFAFVICALLLAMVGSVGASVFVEKTLTSANTEVQFGTYVVPNVQNGTASSIYVNSTSASDTQNITVFYMDSARNRRSLVLNLSGVSNVSSVSGYTYTVNSTSTYALDQESNMTGITNVTNSSQTTVTLNYTPRTLYTLNNVTVNTTGNSNTTANVTIYFNGVKVTNISGNGTVSTVFARTSEMMNNTGVQTISFKVNDTTGYINVTGVSITTVYIQVPRVIFTFPDYAENWTIASQGLYNNATNTCKNYTHIKMLMGSYVDYRTNLTTSTSSLSSNSNGVATLYDVGAGVATLNTTSGTYWDEIWIWDANNGSQKISGVEASNCRNSTATSRPATLVTHNLTTTAFSRTGTLMNYSDVAFITGAQLYSAAAGVVMISDSSRKVLVSIPIGNLTPLDNGASPLCTVSTGCTMQNLVYGGDAAWRFKVYANSTSGTQRTVFSSWIPASTTYSFGSGIIRWSYGERLFITGSPLAASTNTSMYFEVG